MLFLELYNHYNLNNNNDLIQPIRVYISCNNTSKYIPYYAKLLLTYTKYGSKIKNII